MAARSTITLRKSPTSSVLMSPATVLPAIVSAQSCSKVAMISDLVTGALSAARAATSGAVGFVAADLPAVFLLFDFLVRLLMMGEP